MVVSKMCGGFCPDLHHRFFYCSSGRFWLRGFAKSYSIIVIWAFKT